jgi:protocatechuate 3,4-dioxygenase beta subunit
VKTEVASSECSGKTTPSQTEGPYYKAGSPERQNISDGKVGDVLILKGYVFDAECKPVSGAWLDFWQADTNGNYDNVGYELRGHQFTNEEGLFQLQTIVPAAYENRPQHVHVKVKKPAGQIITTQLYFPNQSQNQQDSIFREETVITIQQESNGKTGQFSFVLL